MDALALLAAGICGWEAFKLWGPLPKPTFFGGNSPDIDWRAWGPFFLQAFGALGALIAVAF